MKKRTVYFIAIPLIALLLVAGGGWWANQAGLLGQWLAPVAQTASSVSGGVQAQAGDTQTGQALPSAESGNVFGGKHVPGTLEVPGTCLPDTDVAICNCTSDQAPGQALGSAPASSSAGGSVAATVASATATPETVATTVSATATTANLVTIPAVAGVKGSYVYDAGGALVATLDSGASALLTGRSSDSTWLTVTTAAGEGWVQAAQLIAYGLHRLPVVEKPAAVVSATATPAAATAATAENTAPAIATGAAPAAPGAAGDVLTLTANVATEQTRLNIRSGPSTRHAIVAKADNGTSYVVLGRNDAGDWLQLQLDDGGVGWASAAYLDVAGDASQLPVQLAPAPAAQANNVEPAAITAAGSTSTSASAAIMTVANTANTTAAAAGDLQGTLVFQQSPGGIIYAYNLATGSLWQLTNGFDPAISPDGSTVAFVRDGGESGLYLINIDGSGERRIFARAALSSPKWSPDGQWIVFSRNDEGVECYQMMPNYCMLPEEAKDRFPLGVPGEIPLVTEYQHKLSIVDYNGDNFHDVAALNSARAVDWSDAGIVYQSTAGIQITADGEGAVNQEVIFDNLNPYYFDPDLQPGGQIVFQIKGAAQTDLWVANTDGTGKTALTRPATTLVATLPSNVAPAYSPDGQHIVFLSNRSADNSAGDWHLWVMNADGSNQRQLPIDVAIYYTYGLDQAVSWGA